MAFSRRKGLPSIKNNKERRGLKQSFPYADYAGHLIEGNPLIIKIFHTAALALHFALHEHKHPTW